jgi:hypothetical protein
MKSQSDLVRGWLRNLEKLVELCARRDSSFLDIKSLSQELTPYAVELRYDGEFWPALETASQALKSALAIKEFVLPRLPSELK